MKLMTKEVINTLKKFPLYSQEKTALPDQICSLKFFTPDADWTWFITEGEPVDFSCPDCGHFQERFGKGCEKCGKQNLSQDGPDWLFYGKVVSGMCPEGEYGYVRLSQLQEVRGCLGLPIERDKFWSPKKISDCK